MYRQTEEILIKQSPNQGAKINEAIEYIPRRASIMCVYLGH